MNNEKIEGPASVPRPVQAIVRLLPITNCYQCYRRDYMSCICIDTGKKHPTSDKKIPKWCPLPNTSGQRPPASGGTPEPPCSQGD